VQNLDTIEKVALNDVLPLKATRHGAIANLKFFGSLFHLHSLCSTTLCHWHHNLVSIYGEWIIIPVQSFGICGSKFMRLWDLLGDPL